MTAKKIPIERAREIANNFGYSQVVIFAYDEGSGMQSVATYGKTGDDCVKAADAGNNLKRSLGWPEELCNARPPYKK